MNDNHVLKRVEGLGNFLVTVFHVTALFVIGGSIVWSAVVAYLAIMQHGYAQLNDILLLFIYLELGAMVGIYFKTHHLPVRFLVYIAITALTRFLTVDIKDMSTQAILGVAGAILMLSVAALALQYGASRFGANEMDS